MCRAPLRFAGIALLGLFVPENVFAQEQDAARQDAPPSVGAETMVTKPRGAVPERLVPGEGLIKLAGIHARELVVAKPSSRAAATWKAVSARSEVDLELIRPTFLGWAYIRVRAHGDESVPDEKATMALLDRLAADPAVEAVSANKWYRPLATPNDPYLPNMWHLRIIGAERAWDYTTGNSTQRIGVIDSGLVRDHEDVGARAVAGYDFIDKLDMANDGSLRDADFDDPGDGCGGPSTWHGTHVAGTIAAAANNGRGIAGMNWKAGLVIARALGCTGGQLVDIFEGAAWMAGIHIDGVPNVGVDKVQVMNLSLGSDEACSDAEQQVINLIADQGVIFVAATGNSSGSGTIAPVGSPANCDNVISVASFGPTRDLTSYSSFGPEVDIVAPGGDLFYGTEYGVLSSIGPQTNAYAFLEGTSMAAPHVTGLISLMLDINPWLTSTEIEDLLRETGTTCGGCSGVPALVADAALARVAPGDEPPPTTPSLDDDLEENDDIGSAAPGVECGDAITLTALAEDQDWFEFQTKTGQQITLNLRAHNGADLDLYVRDATSSAVATSASPEGNEQLSFVGTGEKVYVVVDPFLDTETGIANQGSYTLSSSCTGGEGAGPSGDDAFEPNNTVMDATEMYCDALRDFIAADEDWFFVDTRDGDRLAAEITSPGRSLDVQILDDSGDVLAEGTALEVAEVYPVAAGRHYIRVIPVDAGGGYRLRASCTPSADVGLQEIHTIHVRGGCASGGGVPMGVVLAALILHRRRHGNRSATRLDHACRRTRQPRG